jgi:hypothetical protein
MALKKVNLMCIPLWIIYGRKPRAAETFSTQRRAAVLLWEGIFAPKHGKKVFINTLRLWGVLQKTLVVFVLCVWNALLAQCIAKYTQQQWLKRDVLLQQ